MPQVADLWAGLGLKVDKGQWNAGEAAIGRMQTMLGALGAYFGGRFLYGKLISFNSSVEDTKNQIAGMLALTKKTDLVDQLANADMLFANLQRRAASLPGTTAEYTQMLGMLVQPLSKAGLSLQDMEDLTINSVVAAKAFGVQWEVAARDISQALSGQFHAEDVLTGKILGSMGFEGEEGRKRFNTKKASERAQILKDALTQKQLTQLAGAQGGTFSGMMATLEDAVQQFFGMVGKPLFSTLIESIKEATVWLEENREAIVKVAEVIGKALVEAFHFLGKAIKVAISIGSKIVDWIKIVLNDSELLTAVLVGLGIAFAGVMARLVASIAMAAVQLALAFGPFVVIPAAIAGIVLMIRHWDLVKVKVGEAWEWIKRKSNEFFEWLAENGPQLILDAMVKVGEVMVQVLSTTFDILVRMAKAVASEIWSAIKDIPVIGRIAGGIETLVGGSGISGMVADARNLTTRGQGQDMVAPRDGASGSNFFEFGDTQIVVNPTTGMDERKVGEIAAAKAEESKQQMLRDAYDVMRGGTR